MQIGKIVLPSAEKIVPLFFAIPVFVATFGAVCVLLLVLNQFNNLCVLFFAFPVSLLLSSRSYLGTYRRTKDTDNPEQSIRDVGALLLIVAWAIFNLFFASQHVFTNRDPATYILAGAWLVERDSLVIPPITTFDSIEGVVNTSGGFAQLADNQSPIHAQGSHFLPALIGLSGRVVGYELMLHMNVLFGAVALMAIYGFVRLIVRSYWALIALFVFAFSMPFIYFSRDTYTEPLTAAFVFCGLGLLFNLHRIQNKKVWFTTGLVFGSAALLRIDAYLALVAPVIFFVFYLLQAKEKKVLLIRLKNVIVLTVGAAIVSTLAWIDVTRLSAAYYRDVRHLILQELLILIVVVLLGAILVISNAFLRFWPPQASTTRTVGKAAAIIIILLSGLSLLRPLWQATRDHAELTAYWVFVYLGPVVGIMAFIGLAYLVFKGLRFKKYWSLLPFLGLLILVTTVYFLLPSISSDQIWATRRQLPVILPGLAICAAAGLSLLARKLNERFDNEVREPLLTFIIIVTLISPLAFSWPILFSKDTYRLSSVSKTCRLLPKSSSTMLVGLAGYEMVMPLRTYCHFPSVGIRLKRFEKLNEQKLVAYYNYATDNDFVPYIGVYASERHLLAHNLNQAENFTEVDASYKELEQARRRPPLTMVDRTVKILFAQVEFDGRLSPVH